MKLKFNSLLVILCSVCFTVGHSARILGLFASPSRSHLIIHLSVARALLERGHNVTVVTTLPLGEPNPGFRHIQVETEEIPRSFMKEMLESNQKNPINTMQGVFRMISIMLNTSESVVQDPQIRKLMDEDQFDLVILGYFINDFQLGIGAHFKCPVALIWLVQPMTIINDMIGNPHEISYVPNAFSTQKQPFDFWARLKNVLWFMLEYVMKNVIYFVQNNYYERNFPPDRYPSLHDVRRNVSLMLVNHHFTQGPIRPNVPALVEIGGIQVKEKPNPLPTDLQDFLDSATEYGAIYFSLGSNARSSELSHEKIKIIYKIFSQLKQKIIWKWESDKLPGNSPNILFKKWLPQDDILAHPNTKLFVTHGGKGSIIESQYHAVPMIAVPIFGDQTANAKILEQQGFGKGLEFNTLTEEKFRDTILEVLNNKKYQKNIQEFSDMYRDRPQTAKEVAVFWLEYVIRHKGAHHMRSPYVHMNFIEILGLDILAFLLIVTYLVFKILKYIIKFSIFVVKRILGKKKAKTD